MHPPHTKWETFWASALAWPKRLELATLLLILVPAAGVWGFVELADEVFEGETQAVDERILLALRDPQDPADPLGPAWVEEMARDTTALGGVLAIATITFATAIFLALDGKHHAALLVIVAVGGGLALSTVIKAAFDRPRPDLVPHGSHVATSSFPSGHSMMATTTYLTLGALLARFSARRSIKIYFLLLAILLSLAVGASRVYLGVHWPTDVLAGWVLGASWAVLCWAIALRLQRSGAVETESPERAVR